ncbi:MAG: hypothetical protein H7Z37_06175 [Pyrinomonadaceae bacterium]|nr:hypothetical protein [Pyrinomonadaceae bacterium]
MAKVFFCALFMCLLSVIQIQAQQTTTPVAKKIYENIQVEKFTIKSGVEFEQSNIDPLADSLVKAFQKTKRFNLVSLVGETTTADASTTPTTATEAPTLKLSGEIVLYKKGNQGGRYLLGGLGGQAFATRLVALIKFVDTKTGETVLEKSVDGVVSGGFFGGGKSGAKGGIVSDIVKLAKKEVAGDKKQ